MQIQTQTENKTENRAKRLLALILALVTIAGCLPFMALNVFASATAEEEEADEAALEMERIKLFLSTVYANPDEKLKDFGAKIEHVEGTGKNAVTTYIPDGKPVLIKDGYELYYQYDTGEVAIKEQKTGQIMFSNPYDVGAETSTDDTKYKLLSQIIIKYGESDKKYFFNTFQHAALYRQIKMKKIKGGIRVEYTIGKEEKRKLVPRMIERESFETNILSLIPTGRDLDRMNAYYTLKDANAPDLTPRAQTELKITYPITKDMAIYVFDPNASERELTQIENYIKLHTKYTFEMMDEDHQKVGYEGVTKAPPLFKLALEYYIDEQGLYVRLPANGIRFDESNYKIEHINVLPYMGAGRRGNTGYTMIPDGSGALVRYEEIDATPLILTNKIYGPDYSFYKISGGSHTRKWRLPVFGAVENYEIARETKVEPVTVYYDASGTRVETPVTVTVDADGNALAAPMEVYYDETGAELTAPKQIYVDADGNEYDEIPEIEIEKRYDGFLAIIEEGDVMAEITTESGGTVHKYNSTSAQFTPRPVDEYNLSFETKGINSLITVASRRKYAGNYILRFIMISSDENGNPKKAGGYEATYVGMAKAYREYLIAKGDLTPFVDDGSDIPLFIETFGMIKTAEYIMGFPYVGKTPLTTFDDVKSMIDELNAVGVENIKFRLQGWVNGGMRGTAPTKLKIVSTLGGKSGFQDMIDYGKEKGADIYPDLDFALVWNSVPFDGVTPKKDFVRYMDQMYAYEQKYFYLAQDFTGYTGYYLLAHERMDRMYEKTMKDYRDYEVEALSVSSLARELHSNHYKKSLVNRMDSKNYVTDLFDKMEKEHGNLLSEEANAYAFKYLDSVINIDLDSSRFLNQSESIPFYAMVTHGSLNIAGSAINMAGDYQYEVLKAIESGASPYFILSYQNANRLKEAASWSLNSYYAVDYKLWFDKMLETYNTINDALKPVKAKAIIDHEFLQRNVVKVTYEGGTVFVLNYNYENEVTVTVDGKEYVVKPFDFITIN